MSLIISNQYLSKTSFWSEINPLTEITFSATILDSVGQIKYKLLINDFQYYPAEIGFTELFNSNNSYDLSLQINISVLDLAINVITLVVQNSDLEEITYTYNITKESKYTTEFNRPFDFPDEWIQDTNKTEILLDEGVSFKDGITGTAIITTSDSNQIMLDNKISLTDFDVVGTNLTTEVTASDTLTIPTPTALGDGQVYEIVLDFSPYKKVNSITVT